MKTRSNERHDAQMLGNALRNLLSRINDCTNDVQWIPVNREVRILVACKRVTARQVSASPPPQQSLTFCTNTPALLSNPVRITLRQFTVGQFIFEIHADLGQIHADEIANDATMFAPFSCFCESSVNGEDFFEELSCR